MENLHVLDTNWSWKLEWDHLQVPSIWCIDAVDEPSDTSRGLLLYHLRRPTSRRKVGSFHFRTRDRSKCAGCGHNDGVGQSASRRRSIDYEQIFKSFDKNPTKEKLTGCLDAYSFEPMLQGEFLSLFVLWQTLSDFSSPSASPGPPWNCGFVFLDVEKRHRASI